MNPANRYQIRSDLAEGNAKKPNNSTGKIFQDMKTSPKVFQPRSRVCEIEAGGLCIKSVGKKITIIAVSPEKIRPIYQNEAHQELTYEFSHPWWLVSAFFEEYKTVAECNRKVHEPFGPGNCSQGINHARSSPLAFIARDTLTKLARKQTAGFPFPKPRTGPGMASLKIKSAAVLQLPNIPGVR